VANQTISNSWRYTGLTVQKTRWARLPFGVRMTIGSVALLLPCVGAAFGVGALVDQGAETITSRGTLTVGEAGPSSPPADAATWPPSAGTGMGTQPGLPRNADTAALVTAPQGTTIGVPAPAAAGPGVGTTMPQGGTPVDPTTGVGTTAPVEAPPPPPPNPPSQPTVETTTVTETQAVPFQTEFVRDSSMPRRQHEVRSPGQEGVRTLTYEVTTTDGQQTDKRLISDAITKEPVTRVIAVGTDRRDQNCDSAEHRCDDAEGPHS
jgi:hypothetical protein